MKQELMDKTVLCILDTRQIQRYIFRSNSLIDTLGGSDILDHVLDDALRFSFKNIDTPLSEDEYDLTTDPEAEVKFFSDEKIKFQVITCNAGNALCIVRTGALAQKIIRNVSRYYLDHGYSLNVSAAVIEKTESFGGDIFNLYKELNSIKAAATVSNPLGALGVIMKEERTGEPVIGIDEEIDDHISKSSEIRRKEARKRTRIVDVSQITKTLSMGKEYIAVIHADGNNLGTTIGRMMQTATSYEQGIARGRYIHKNIKTSFRQVLQKTKENLEQKYNELFPGEDRFDTDFFILHQAGDDVNIICRATLAFPFLDFFYKNMKDVYMWDRDGERVPLYVCAGVSFITEKESFHTAFEIAEECCSNAKVSAKKEENLREGYAGNWIDFHICNSNNIQELDVLRQEFYVGDDGMNMVLRPYCLDKEAEESSFSYASFINRVRAFRRIGFTEEDRRSMELVYMQGKTDLDNWVADFEKKRNVKLVDELGNPVLRVRGEDTRAIWFDAEQMVDFII